MLFLNKFLYILGNQKKRFYLLIPIFLLSAFLDIIALSILMPYLGLVLKIENPYLVSITSYLESQSILFTEFQMIIIGGIFILLAYVLKFIIGVFVNYKIFDYCFNIGRVIRNNLMKNILSTPYDSFHGRKTSDFVYLILTLSSEYSQNLVQSILRLLSDGLIIIFISIFLIIQEPYAFLILLLVMVPTILCYYLFIRNRNFHYGERVNKSNDSLIESVINSINGLKEIRIYKLTKFINQRFETHSQGFASNAKKAYFISGLPKYFLEFALILSIIILVFSSLFRDDSYSLIQTLAVFAFGGLRILPSLNQMTSNISQLRYSNDMLDRLHKQIQSFEDLEGDSPKQSLGEELGPFKILSIKGLEFSYPETETPVFKNFNLEIKQGEFIGIKGNSGSGKTTLIDLITGLIKPQQGSVLINSLNLENRIEEFREKISYVPQHPFFISDDVLTNVTFLQEPEEKDKQRVVTSLERSQSKNFLLSGELKNEFIDESGKNISGGQKQRLAIARALFFDREILIFDECFSALDKENSNKILEELSLLKGKKTIILISHEDAYFRYCDKTLDLNSPQQNYE